MRRSSTRHTRESGPISMGGGQAAMGADGHPLCEHVYSFLGPYINSCGHPLCCCGACLKAHASIGPDSLGHANSTRHTRVTARERVRRAPQAHARPYTTYQHKAHASVQAATRPLPYTSENTSSPDKTGSNKARASATKAATRNEPRSISRASRVRHAPLLQTRASRGNKTRASRPRNFTGA